MFFNPCCCGSCAVFEDKFNRTDSTTLGSDWTEISGSWEIASNELKVTSSNAIAQCDLPEDCQNFSIKFKGSNNDVIRYGYHDGTNWHTYIEIKIGTNQYIKAFDLTGVRNNCEITLAADTWHELLFVTSTTNYMSIAINGDYTMSGGPYPQLSTAVIHVGTGAISGSVYFDDLIASKNDLAVDSVLEICKNGARCFWPFEVNTPTELMLDVSDMPAGYTDYEGVYTLEIAFDAATDDTGDGCMYTSDLFTVGGSDYFWVFGFCDPDFVVALVPASSSSNPCFGHSVKFYKDALADDCRFKDTTLNLFLEFPFASGTAVVSY